MNNQKGILMKITMLTIALALITALTGCNTVKGMGKDLQVGGQEIQKAAN